MLSGLVENLFDGPKKLSQQRAMNETGVLVLPGLATVQPHSRGRAWYILVEKCTLIFTQTF